MFKLTGTIKVLKSAEVISDKFKKRELVLTDSGGMYPQDISFQLTQDKCSIADSFNVGDVVELSFNLRGREWTSPQGEVKYFNTLEAWRIESGQGSAPPPIPTINKVDVLATTADDLPF